MCCANSIRTSHRLLFKHSQMQCVHARPLPAKRAFAFKRYGVQILTGAYLACANAARSRQSASCCVGRGCFFPFLAPRPGGAWPGGGGGLALPPSPGGLSLVWQGCFHLRVGGGGWGVAAGKGLGKFGVPAKGKGRGRGQGG
jgi:hypothetical protein